MATLYIKKGIVSQYIMQNLWIEQPVLYANAFKIDLKNKKTYTVHHTRIKEIIRKSDFKKEKDFYKKCDDLCSHGFCSGEFVTDLDIYFVVFEDTTLVSQVNEVKYKDCQWC